LSFRRAFLPVRSLLIFPVAVSAWPLSRRRWTSSKEPFRSNGTWQGNNISNGSATDARPISRSHCPCSRTPFRRTHWGRGASRQGQENGHQSVENRKTIALKGQAISLVGLGEALELPPRTSRSEPPEALPVVVLTWANQRIAFFVDEVLGEQEVLLKTLGKQLTRVRNIAGATILGNGRVVPILNVADLMTSAVRVSQAGLEAPGAETAAMEEKEKKSVLVAEDSITSRSLLKSISKAPATTWKRRWTELMRSPSCGVPNSMRWFRMWTCLDEWLRPHREDPGRQKLAELPVILVTALDSRADREHALTSVPTPTSLRAASTKATSWKSFGA